MANVETKSNESQLHLEAMLYLLADPALDRDAFEAKLANDPRLGEILAQSVTVFQSLESLEFDSQTIVRVAHPSSQSYRSWISLATIAASLLLMGFLGLQTLAPIKSIFKAENLTFCRATRTFCGILTSETEQREAKGSLLRKLDISGTRRIGR